MADRADYRRALETGVGAWDVSGNREIKSEMNKLWAAMEAVMAKHAKPGAKADDAKRVH